MRRIRFYGGFWLRLRPPILLCVIVSLNAEIADNFDLMLYTAQWSRLKGMLVIMWRGLRFGLNKEYAP